MMDQACICERGGLSLPGKRLFVRILPILPCLMVFACRYARAQDTTDQRVPRVIRLEAAAVQSTDILRGRPETVTMRSGYMVLGPGRSVGRHSTKGNEEAVIVLKGTGEMRLAGGKTLALTQWSIAYCPPMTEHDVINTGQDTLRYVWLVAKAAP